MEDYFRHKFRSGNPFVIVGLILLAIVAISGFAILFGFIVMWLWNWLAPTIFGLPEIGYWQAVGLFILFKILFGGFGGGHGGKSHKKRKRRGKENCREEEYKDEFSKWKFYGKFWEEEGKKAFDDYVSRKKPNQSSDEEE